MAVTVADIRANHRDFANTDHPTDAEVQAAIDRAEAQLDESTLGDQYDDAVEMMTCQDLATSGYARDLRLRKDSERTLFDQRLERILMTRGRSQRPIP